jgi:hypothetical protein
MMHLAIYLTGFHFFLCRNHHNLDIAAMSVDVLSLTKRIDGLIEKKKVKYAVG